MATEAPKNTPISAAELAKYDGSDPSQPIYVAIKGDIFDVTKNKDSYAKGQGYNVFCGKDASRALGMSSLKPEDCVADYSTLTEKELETLDQWHAFFSKRYNIIGKVVD
ncbi:cytochrome b5-like heme/steroid binding domain-containing protein [Gongronella butleri]|nr:cytochrome b5-like heme/steroid binding domain-containing protein [Gongronella butleri]